MWDYFSANTDSVRMTTNEVTTPLSCAAMRGTCKSTEEGCSEGSFLHGKCRGQVINAQQNAAIFILLNILCSVGDPGLSCKFASEKILQGEKGKCCVSCQDGSNCSQEARDLACELAGMEENGQVTFAPNHFAKHGNNPPDGAAALRNIMDTCQGKMARR